MSPIFSIVKRRDIRKHGDVYLPQRTNGTFHMSAHMYPLDEDNIAARLRNQILAKLNKCTSAPRNNMNMFRYIPDIIEGLENDDLHALDNCLVTSDVVSTVALLYENDLQDKRFCE